MSKKWRVKNNHVVTPNAGAPCPRCRQTTELRTHRTITSRELARPFYYRFWYNCTNRECLTGLIMPPEARVFRGGPQSAPTATAQAPRRTMAQEPCVGEQLGLVGAKRGNIKDLEHVLSWMASELADISAAAGYPPNIEARMEGLRETVEEIHAAVAQRIAEGKLRRTIAAAPARQRLDA